VGAGNGGGDRGLIGHVGGDDRDPVETHRSQLNPRRVRMPHRDAYSHPLGEQAMYESPTEETGTANTTTVVIICSGTLGSDDASVDVGLGQDFVARLSFQ
jgi:hypothetical protein